MFTKVLANDGKPFRRPQDKINLPSSNLTNGQVSKRAAKRIRDKINWLVQISKRQRVVYPNGGVSDNFRISMITLTLPSQQVHSDKEIKDKCLNQFLTELRQDCGMEHYVWKAELQNNENIHFHITTNTFVNHVKVRNKWNRIVSKLGYVQAYADKMRGLSFEEYHRMRSESKPCKLSDSKKAWAAGNAQDWCSPNSTDIKTVFRVGNLAAYLAKYLAKSVSGQAASNLDQSREKEFGGRIWYCSQSLSKLKSYVTLQSNRAMEFCSRVIKSAGTRLLEFDYCKCFYFDPSKFPPDLKRDFDLLLGAYVKLQLS